MNRTLPQPGQRYGHSKDTLSQIIALATHSETGEEMVVYQELHDDFKVYVRPLSLFLNETAHTEESSTPIPPSEKEPLPDGISPKLMAFLDADTSEDRYRILSEMEDLVDNHMIDTMAVVLDIVIEDGPIEVRYQELKNCLRTRIRYETNRFR